MYVFIKYFKKIFEFGDILFIWNKFIDFCELFVIVNVLYIVKVVFNVIFYSCLMNVSYVNYISCVNYNKI